MLRLKLSRRATQPLVSSARLGAPTALPSRHSQVAYLVEMIAARDHRQSMLHGNGDNPNIVFWDWSIPNPEVVLNSPVLPPSRC